MANFMKVVIAIPVILVMMRGIDAQCDSSEYRCYNGQCIPGSWKCDREDDCGDNSDELVCFASSCSSGEFACATESRCLPSSWKCDGEDDCGDGSDESMCSVSVFSSGCSSDEFQCNIGRCIPSAWKCDNEDDCGDNSDESSCSGGGCSSDRFRCLNGNCIPFSWKCDNENDCGDNSDKSTCSRSGCSADEFQCNNGKCIPGAWKCDNEDDCGDYSDESSCSGSSCSSDEFTCLNGRCLPIAWKCDNEDDCGDNSDEALCSSPDSCGSGEFQCQNRKCIPLPWKCDEENDCGDNSDESSCVQTTTPRRMADQLEMLPEDCGVTSTSKIIGGTVAAPGSFPWMVKLSPMRRGGKISGNCGGALINSQWVLTAAHCVKDELDSVQQLADFVTLKLGKSDLKSDEEEGVERTSLDIVVHPYYSSDYKDETLNNYDFALIKMSPVTFTQRIKPICLPKSCDQTSTCSNFTVAGWGVTENYGKSDVLLFATEELQYDSKCNSQLTDYLGNKITLSESQMCVGNGYPTSCRGDSGGPLACTINDKTYAAGLVSWGVKGCRMEGAASVYSKTCAAMSWIVSTLKMG